MSFLYLELTINIELLTIWYEISKNMRFKIHLINHNQSILWFRIRDYSTNINLNIFEFKKNWVLIGLIDRDRGFGIFTFYRFIPLVLMNVTSILLKTKIIFVILIMSLVGIDTNILKITKLFYYWITIWLVVVFF